MKKLFYLSLAAGAILMFTNCDNTSIEPINTGNHINFNNMLVGQKSSYVRFESRNVWQDSDTTFKQTADTLNLTIVSQDENGFKISEDQLPKKIATFFYYFTIKNDSLLVKPVTGSVSINSTIFNFGASKFVLKDTNLPKWTLTKWARPKDLTITEGFGKTGDFTIMGKRYTDAFAYYNSNPMIFDGPLVVQLYTKADGFISFQALGGLAPFGSIYNLIP